MSGHEELPAEAGSSGGVASAVITGDHCYAGTSSGADVTPPPALATPPPALAPHSTYLSSSQGRGVIAVVIDKGQGSQEGAESPAQQQPALDGHQDTHQQGAAGEASGRAGGPPPPPPEEPTVDVMTEEEGRGQLVQNMLSSIVYSLGLTEAEELQYLTHWHNRTIVPTLDSSTLA